MATTKLRYFADADILHLALTDEPEAGSVEISPEVTAELNAAGELIGVEIISASTWLRDTLLATTPHA